MWDKQHHRSIIVVLYGYLPCRLVSDGWWLSALEMGAIAGV